MGMIVCPNCGKKTFDDEKCGYCKYPLKKKENSFDSAQYKFLKAAYEKEGNKAATIKKGMQQFGISMQEAKEIVDFIADEAYERESVRPKEQVDEQLKAGGGFYKFSLGAYLIHFGIYHIVIEALLVWVILFCRDHGIIKEYPLVVAIWFALEIIFVLYIGVRFFKNASASFSLEPGNYVYNFRIPELRGNNGTRDAHYRRTYTCYRITAVTEIEEHLNSFVLHGTIMQEEARHIGVRLDSAKSAQLKKIKVPKCFRHNKELIKKLKK